MRSKVGEWLTEDGLLLIQGWARDGLTELQIAKNMGVAMSTLSDWKIKHPEILEALKKSKALADREVENALFQKAKGYTIKVRKPMKIRKVILSEETGRKIEEYDTIVYVDDEIHIPPDTTAQIFWLKNRKPKEWRDKVVAVDETSLEKLDDLIGSIDKLAEVRQ